MHCCLILPEVKVTVNGILRATIFQVNVHFSRKSLMQYQIQLRIALCLNYTSLIIRRRAYFKYSDTEYQKKACAPVGLYLIPMNFKLESNDILPDDGVYSASNAVRGYYNRLSSSLIKQLNPQSLLIIYNVDALSCSSIICNR